jgi:hypothetical protein
MSRPLDVDVVVVLARVEALATDVGRLRRRFASNADAWTGPFFLDLIARHIQVIQSMLVPTAAEVYAANLWYCGDEHQAVTAALAEVDARERQLRSLLGIGPR